MRCLLGCLCLFSVIGCGGSESAPDDEAVEVGGTTTSVESKSDQTVLSPVADPASHDSTRDKPASSPADEATSVESAESIGMRFVAIPAGTFVMGSPETRYSNETLHQVTLTTAFEMGVHEVTQDQYEQVMGENPSVVGGPQHPVEHLSWEDAVEFCRRLSELPAEKAAGFRYRLPTEAEWEYACRAGTKTKYSFGDSDSQLDDYAWYYRNASGTEPVGGRRPNPWGLHDMHGNVSEWCQDSWGNYSDGPVTDPTGPSEGWKRVYRGGSHGGLAEECRSSARSWFPSSDHMYGLGFRVVRISGK